LFSLFPLEVAPLRERKEDIVPLLNFFLNQYNRKTGENKRFDRESYVKLLAYHWPGNVRELQNLVSRSAIICLEETISPLDLFIQENIEYVSQKQGIFPEKRDLKEEVAKLEAEFMENAFRKHQNIRAAAQSLGMDSSTFVRKRQRYEQMGLMKKSKKINKEIKNK
jgi:DNA-binding NtrC family response regulator